MTLIDHTDTPRRHTAHWLAMSFCALGILMAAFFNLGTAYAGNPVLLPATHVAD